MNLVNMNLNNKMSETGQLEIYQKEFNEENNIILEQKEKRNAQRRERFANRTPEQREKLNKYWREYNLKKKINLQDDMTFKQQKEKRKQYMKKYYKKRCENKTSEQKKNTTNIIKNMLKT